jgi:hypothetical protein
MKINPNPIHQLSALIGASASHFTLHLSLFTLLFLLLPLTAFADIFYVSGTAASGNGETYEAVSGTAALTVNGLSSAASYTGTNITLISAIDDENSGSYGAFVMQGRLDLTGGNVTYTGSTGVGVGLGISAIQSCSVTLNNVQINSNESGVLVMVDSTLNLTGGSITANLGGIMLAGASTGTLNNVEITVTGSGVGDLGSGVGGMGVVVCDSSSLSLTGGSINTSGSLTHGIMVSGTEGGVSSGTGSATVTDVNITATGEGANALHLADNGIVTVNLNDKTLTGGLYSGGTSALTLSGSNGTVLTGDVTGADHSTVNLTLSGEDTKLVGNITQDATSTVTLSLSDGAAFVGGGTVTNLTLGDDTILGYGGDTLTLTGTISIGEGILIDFGGVTVDYGDEFIVLDWTGATVTGSSISVTSFTAANLGPDMTGSFTVADNQLTFNVTAVPEPSTYFLLGTGLGVLLLAAHRRRHVQS